MPATEVTDPQPSRAPRRRGWLFAPGGIALALGLLVAAHCVQWALEIRHPGEWPPLVVLGALAAGLTCLGATWVVSAFTRLPRVPPLAWWSGAVVLLALSLVVGITAFVPRQTSHPSPTWWPHVVGSLALGVGALDLLLLAILAVSRTQPTWPEPWKAKAARVGLAALPLWILASLFFLSLERPPDPRRVAARQCINSIRQMSCLLSERSIGHGWPECGGKAFVLSLVEDGVVDPADRRNLEVFVCPLHRDEMRREGIFTTYAGRRNDAEAYRLTPERLRKTVPILACLAHDGGVIVGYSDGAARVLDREQLGLGPDDPIVVGEDAKSPILLQLSAD